MIEIPKTEMLKTYPDLEYAWDKFDYKLRKQGLYISGLSFSKDREEACKTVWLVDENMELIEEGVL